MSKNTAMTLFSFAGMLATDEEQAIFKSKTDPILDKNGKQIGEKTVFSQLKAKDAKALLSLESKADKEEFERVRREVKVAEFRKIKLVINSMDETQVGLERFSHKVGKDGLHDMTFRIKEAPAKQSGFTIEQVMEGFKCTREEAMEKLAVAGLKPATKVVVQDPALAKISEGQAEVAHEEEATELAASKK